MDVSTISTSSRRVVRSASTCSESCSMVLHSKNRTALRTALKVARMLHAVHCDRLTHLDNVVQAAEDCTS